MDKKRTSAIFFIALLPTYEIQEEVTRFKQYASENFNSSHALKSPPHITLQAPFKWEFQELEELKQTLQHFSATQVSFDLTIKNFDNFPQGVIFVDVQESAALRELQKNLTTYLRSELVFPKDKNAHPFHPHMTVAFKDLKRAIFPEAWDYFSKQNYERTFKAEKITLLQHDGKRWQVLKDYFFS